MNDEKYKVKWTGAFKKDYKLIQKRGYDTELLKEVVHLIAKGNKLTLQHRTRHTRHSQCLLNIYLVHVLLLHMQKMR